MKKTIKLCLFSEFVFVSVMGTLLHFLYDWTQCIFVAPFSAVNESTWEHMKILFFPMMIFAAIEWFYIGKNNEAYWCIKFKGILIALTLIPTMFYMYNGVIGKSPQWIDIGIFFASAGIALLWSAKQFNKENNRCKHKTASIVGIMIIAIMFIVFTFIKPNLQIFADPLTQ